MLSTTNNQTSQPNPTTNSPSFTATHSTLPVKRLTYAEMRARREKGLCYNCNETFKPDHKCKTQELFQLVGDEEIEEEGPNMSDLLL